MAIIFIKLRILSMKLCPRSAVLQCIYSVALLLFAVNYCAAEPAFGYHIKTDVAYGKGKITVDGKPIMRDLLLDVYTPSAPENNKARPAVILIHGGGFQRGGLRQDPYKEEGAVHSRMEDYARLLAPLGYNVFVIEYRLSPEIPEPEASLLEAEWLVDMNSDLTDAGMSRVNYARSALGLGPLEGEEGKTILWKTILSAAEDLNKAVKYVKKSAKTYKTNPKKIALGGHSAGSATIINTTFGLDAPVQAIFPLSPPVSAIDVKVISDKKAIPTLLVMSQNDEPAVMEKVPEITKIMRDSNPNFELVWVPGFPHFYPYGAVSLSDDATRMSVSDRIIQFLQIHLN